MRSQWLDAMVEIRLLDTYLAWLFIAAIFFRVVGYWRYRKMKNTLELQKNVKLADIIVIVQAGILLMVCISLLELVCFIGPILIFWAFLFNETVGTVIAAIILIGHMVKYIFKMSDCLHSCRKYLGFMFSGAFAVPLLLIVVIFGLLQIFNKELANSILLSSKPIVFLSVYAAYMILYGIIWVLSSLIVDAEVAKVANSIFSASLSILVTIINFIIMGLPFLELVDSSFRFFGFEQLNDLLIQLAQFLFNLITVPFILISLLSIQVIDMHSYWKKKAEKVAQFAESLKNS